MAEVIDIKNRVKEKEDLNQLQKLEELWNLIQCSKCAMRCAKCGVHGEPTSQVNRSGVSFRLCSSCMEEYQQVLTELKGKHSSAKP
ncbi:MAG: hypothetical protein JRI34_13905, partial [Deltaproteobacteria bacterium]|nr:hypothetical protein [Deltaproteobacteria bacterium]